jgi:hypothetical protein
MKSWFFDNPTGAKGGDKVPQLWGANKNICGDVDDFVPLRVPVDEDRLPEFIQNNFGLLFNTLKTTSNRRQALISSQNLSTFAVILSTILASILKFGRLISWYIVQNKHALVGMLSGWTILLQLCG